MKSSKAKGPKGPFLLCADFTKKDKLELCD